MLRPGYISMPRTSLLATNSSQGGTASNSVDKLLVPFCFPPTRSVLWDHRDIGPPSVIHLTHHRNPLVLIDETVLRLAQRLAKDSTIAQCTFHLSGRVCPETDGGGITISIDQLNTSKGSSHNSILSSKSGVTGRINIPFALMKDGPVPQRTVDDFVNSIQLLDKWFRAGQSIDLSHFMSLRMYSSCHQKFSSPSTSLFQLNLYLIYPGVRFKVTPINVIPIVPTALSKNLCTQLNISEVQGEPKTGYLSMDHTRKLLLVLESDPKVKSLPLVGIWVAGLANVEDPFVWASLLRFVFCKNLKDRVCLPPEPFLIVLFAPSHCKPEFYECVTTNGRQNLEFELSSCHDVVKTNQDNIALLSSPVEMELETLAEGEALNTLQAAMQIFRRKSVNHSHSLRQNSSEEMDQPRLVPVRPHSEKEAFTKPSVPEVTLLFDCAPVQRQYADSPVSNGPLTSKSNSQMISACSPRNEYFTRLETSAQSQAFDCNPKSEPDRRRSSFEQQTDLYSLSSNFDRQTSTKLTMQNDVSTGQGHRVNRFPMTQSSEQVGYLNSNPVPHQHARQDDSVPAKQSYSGVDQKRIDLQSGIEQRSYLQLIASEQQVVNAPSSVATQSRNHTDSLQTSIDLLQKSLQMMAAGNEQHTDVLQTQQFIRATAEHPVQPLSSQRSSPSSRLSDVGYTASSLAPTYVTTNNALLAKPVGTCMCCCQSQSPQQSTGSVQEDRQPNRLSLSPQRLSGVGGSDSRGTQSIGQLRSSPNVSTLIANNQPEVESSRSKGKSRHPDVTDEQAFVESKRHSSSNPGFKLRYSDEMPRKSAEVRTSTCKVETVDSLLSAICEPSSSIDMRTLGGDNSGSTDSGLPVNDTSFCSINNLSSTADPRQMTVQQQFESVRVKSPPRQHTALLLQSNVSKLSEFGIKQTCTVAVNTSMYWPTFPSDQTTATHTFDMNTNPRAGSSHRPSSSCSTSSNVHESFDPNWQDQRQVRDELERHNWMNASQVDENTYLEKQADSMFCSPPSFVSPSEGSVVSEMIVEMPEYESPSPDKSDMSQITSLRKNFSTSNDSMSSRSSLESHASMRRTQERNRGSLKSSGSSASVVSRGNASSNRQVNQSRKVQDVLPDHSKLSIEPTVIDLNGTMMFETAYLPKLNYVPTRLGESSAKSRSAADMTAVVSAVDAAAVKYLNDQQLVQHVRSGGTRWQASSNFPADNHRASDESAYGLKSVNLSMASRKYFEKHGLVGHSSPLEQRGARLGGKTRRSNVQNLIESITSQVNNLQLAASPARSAHFTPADVSVYDPSLYDVGDNNNETWLSEQCATRYQNAEHEELVKDHFSMLDRTYDGSGSSCSEYQGDTKGMLLRSVDRTLEFSDSVVFDSQEPRQDSYHR